MQVKKRTETRHSSFSKTDLYEESISTIVSKLLERQFPLELENHVLNFCS